MASQLPRRVCASPLVIGRTLPDMAENTEANQLKGRRAAATKTEAGKSEEGNVTGQSTPVAVGADEPARNYFMLGDPREPRQVLEASGGMYGEVAGDDFVIAPEDAFEELLPPGCKTAVTRLRWAKGQHVPIEVYRAHQAAQGKAEPEAAAS